MKALASGAGPSLRDLLVAYFAENPDRLDDWSFQRGISAADAADGMLGNMVQALARLREISDNIEGEDTPAANALRALLTRVTG